MVNMLHLRTTVAICRSNFCQILAIMSHPSGILAIPRLIMQLTAGTLASVWLWPYGQWWGAAMTHNTPGKIPITNCSSENQRLQKHDGGAAHITACQAADYSLSHTYSETWCTCKMWPEHRESNSMCVLSMWISANKSSLHSLPSTLVNPRIAYNVCSMGKIQQCEHNRLV